MIDGIAASVRLEKLSESTAKSNASPRVIPSQKGVATDEFESAETKWSQPLFRDLQNLGIQVHPIVRDAGLQILVLCGESFTELCDNPLGMP